MTTTANELGEREKKGKPDKETEDNTDWPWICSSNDENYNYLNLHMKYEMYESL
jgi:hypothetical protein